MKVLGYNLRLKQQLLTYFLIFAVVPSVFITGVTIVSNNSTVAEAKSELTSQQLKTLSGLGDQLSDVINSWVHDKYKTADTIASDPSIRSNIELLGNPNQSSAALK